MGKKTGNGGTVHRYWQQFLQWASSLLVRCWWRTLRLRVDDSTGQLLDDPSPAVLLFWHNRLFAVPEWYRRFFKERRLAALVSASGDGARLAGFMEDVGIRCVRGSSHNQGASALRNCFRAIKSGWDVAITPDGSRGPVYEMKQGAAALAVRMGAPVYIISLDYCSAVRLNSWDRFFAPLPFSKVQVSLKRVVLTTESIEEAQRELQAQLDASTRD